MQQLMGRTKTTLPSSAKLLQPALIKGVRQNLTTCRQTEIDGVNRNKHKPAPFQAIQEVLLRERHKQWVPAEVVQAVPNSRSYIIDLPRGRYRRNSWFLKPSTISPQRIPPGGRFPEVSESLQSTLVEPGHQGAGNIGPLPETPTNTKWLMSLRKT
ncbi:hypothetical protein PR048_032698 [Dryococelus australis]|uniref:Uncharacterized protein n=1 Tax=Dryococelus australis TaxID=614101 RepID=A0ABQ9G430_9NEOP|nr:hypothetical protein PR048_032698 [Dryococelus australis]